jgi:hypothetical protein
MSNKATTQGEQQQASTTQGKQSQPKKSSKQHKVSNKK